MVVVCGVDTHAGAGHAVLAVGDALGNAFLGKRAVTVIDIELVWLGVIADGNVGPAVLIGVENRNPQVL